MKEIDKVVYKDAEVIYNFLMGNKEATDFVLRVYQIFHIWDDLIDKDKEITNEEINKVFWIALIELPDDPFYRANYLMLKPILINSIINWKAANVLEKEKEFNISFILRGAYIDILTMCALLVGGVDHCDKVTPQIRMWEHAEGFDNYVNEFEVKS